MSTIGGILLFVAGLACGGSAVAYNQYSIKNAIKGLQKENDHLKESSWKDRLDYETNRAYGKGYHDGRRVPISDVERFAETLDGGNFEFRMQRKGVKHGQEENK